MQSLFRMKKVTLSFFSLFFLFQLSLLPAQIPAKYWVQFKDKNDSPYSVENPEKFLSKRAIERRERYQIPITEEDLPVNDRYVNFILSLDTGIMLMTKSKWMNGITIYSDQKGIDKIIEQLPYVEFCEKTMAMSEPEMAFSHYYQYPESGTLPEVKTARPFQDIDYGKGEQQMHLNNIHWLHRMGFKGEGMLMTVMDAGFFNVDSIKHFDVLRRENRLLGVKNFVLPEQDLFREDSHGTMVLSCIASDIPGELVGTAPNIMLFLAKTEDARSECRVEEDNWVAGMEWADSLGCYIVNSSLGYTKFDDSTKTRTYVQLNGQNSRASLAATVAATKGMIVCNSAGNEGRREWKYIGCPADARDILSVGAVDIDRKKAKFSSFGPTADGRVKPDACAVGEKAYLANPSGATITANGTSFASPLLAGMVACLWQAFPGKSNYEIMQAVRESGHQAAHPDGELGYGITDFLKAYNLLLQPDNNQDGKKWKVVIPSYVQDKKLFFIQLDTEEAMTITITANYRKTGHVQTKTYSLNPGLNDLNLKWLRLNKGEKYDIVDLKFEGRDSTKKYVIGVEQLSKRK